MNDSRFRLLDACRRRLVHTFGVIELLLSDGVLLREGLDPFEVSGGGDEAGFLLGESGAIGLKLGLEGLAVRLQEDLPVPNQATLFV